MTEPCGVVYGTGLPWPSGSATCVRPKDHPMVADDRIGHSAVHVAGDEATEASYVEGRRS